MKTAELVAIEEHIEEHYGSRTAMRFKVPLVNHIHEGLAILDAVGASEEAKRAFCIHPLTQNEVPLPPQCDDEYVNELANRYAITANSYLCRPDTDHIRTIQDLDWHLRDIRWWDQDLIDMLYADKIQNRKDFRLYHDGTHARSKQLAHYFDLWIEYLNPRSPAGRTHFS